MLREREDPCLRRWRSWPRLHRHRKCMARSAMCVCAALYMRNVMHGHGFLASVVVRTRIVFCTSPESREAVEKYRSRDMPAGFREPRQDKQSIKARPECGRLLGNAMLWHGDGKLERLRFHSKHVRPADIPASMLVEKRCRKIFFLDLCRGDAGKTEVPKSSEVASE